METTSLSLNQIVALMRHQAGLSQAEIAEELGVHKNTIANLENGRQNPLPWLRDIEKVTGKPEGWAEAFIDPLSFYMKQQKDIDQIKRDVAKILKLLGSK